jgi:Na+-transporting NADH:ubiquinone oxidoreductase subunit E
MSYLRLFLDAAFSENLALTFFLGMCTFVAVSRRVETALGLGCAVVLVQTITVPVNCLLQRHLLRQGALTWAGIPEVDVGYVGLLLYVGVVAAIIQILEMVLERFVPHLHAALGVFLPLLTVNCAILGGTLFSVERNYSVIESVAWGSGSGFGWALALVMLAGIREKLTYSDPPEGLRGLGLTFIVVGLMALGFLGLAGVRFG